jgi:hypothetical protein
MSDTQYTGTDQLPPYGVIEPLDAFGAMIGRREPPGEAFPPVNPVLGAVNPQRPPRPSELLMTATRYLAMLAQRSAPGNEQTMQGFATLAAGPNDIDLQQVTPGLTFRVHRVIVVGTAADTPTVSLLLDQQGAAVTNIAGAIAAWRFAALDADGAGMQEPRELHVPDGHRLIARVRGAVGPFWIGVYGRAYHA